MLKSFIGWHFWLYRKKIHLRSFKFQSNIMWQVRCHVSSLWFWNQTSELGKSFERTQITNIEYPWSTGYQSCSQFINILDIFLGTVALSLSPPEIQHRYPKMTSYLKPGDTCLKIHHFAEVWPCSWSMWHKWIWRGTNGLGSWGVLKEVAKPGSHGNYGTWTMCLY